MTSRSYFSDREVVKGKVTFVNNATHMIRVDDEVVRTNDVPKKTLEKIIVGTFIEATFPKNSQYARSVVITEEVTMDKDFETAIREMEPFVSFIHTLSESEQAEIRTLYRNSVRDAISLYAVTGEFIPKVLAGTLVNRYHAMATTIIEPIIVISIGYLESFNFSFDIAVYATISSIANMYVIIA